MNLSYMDVKRQSENVYAQFGDGRWKDNAEANAKLDRRDPQELRNIGVGKTCVLVAMGSSIERHIDLLKEHRAKIDIFCCDKAFGMLLDKGIKADFVNLADANIPVKWIEPYIRETKGVKLIAGSYANPEWTQIWQGDRYFYVNMDAINTERIFGKIMKDRYINIAAGSCVGNAMVIFMTQSAERAGNFAGYNQYLLSGFDLGYLPKGNYYAFNDPTPKRNYMKHRTMLTKSGDPIYTSENLLFSNKWLADYVRAYRLPVKNCSPICAPDMPRGDIKAELETINPDPQAARDVKYYFDFVLKKKFEELENCKLEFLKLKEKTVWPQSAVAQAQS